MNCNVKIIYFAILNNVNNLQNTLIKNFNSIKNKVCARKHLDRYYNKQHFNEYFTLNSSIKI